MSYYERTLPHWHPESRDLFLTWRLSGSLPAKVMEALRRSRSKEMGKRFREYDSELDRSASGPLWLKDEEIAAAVAEEIEKAAESGLCGVHAWVIMPNHVHLLMRANAPVSAITKAVKGASGRRANQLLGRTGKYFWQDECFDHWIRNEAEFEKVKEYVVRNPVMAGFVAHEEEWKWSSAGGPCRKSLQAR